MAVTYHRLCMRSVPFIFNRSFFTWRHHFLKSKTKEQPKFLSSSVIRGGIFISVYNFTAQSVLRLETGAFRSSGLWRCVTQVYDRVCWKIYSYHIILSLFKSLGIRKSAYVNTCLFSTGNQSPRKPEYVPAVYTIFRPPYWCTTDVH